MAKNETPDTTKTTALAVGAVLALGFATWRVTSALAPTGGAAPAENPATPVEAAQTAEPAIPLELQRPPTAAQPGGPLADPAEETLAPTADPFQPLLVAAAPPEALPAAVVSAPPFGGPGVLPANHGIAVEVTPGPALPVEPGPPPPLVGTLLGDQPSAVFKTPEGLLVVRRGQQIDAWRVVAVQHGAATVRAGKLSRLLTVNARMGAIAVTPAAQATEPTRPEMMAVLPLTMTLPTAEPPLPATPKAPPTPAVPEPIETPADTPATTPFDAAPTAPTAPTAPAPAVPEAR